MDKINYDMFRILNFVDNRSMVTRSKMTKELLARLPHLKMKSLYDLVDTMVDNGWLSTFREHFPNRPGPRPIVYILTPRGLTWLKEKRRENKKMVKKLK